MSALRSTGPARQGATIARPSLYQARATAEAEWQAMGAMLAGLQPADWSRDTACGEWSVTDVVAHVVGQYEGAARPWVMLRRIRTARRTHPELGTLDGQNAVQVQELAGRSPAELVRLHRSWAARGTRAFARMPGPARRARLSRVFPEAREQPEDSLDYLVRVLASRDAWMHRLDVADAVGVAVTPGSHDHAHVEQVIRDLATTWDGPAALIELSGAGAGRWTIGAGEPRAVLRAEGLDLARHLAGRDPRGAQELTGDREAARLLHEHRMPF